MNKFLKKAYGVFVYFVLAFGLASGPVSMYAKLFPDPSLVVSAFGVILVLPFAHVAYRICDHLGLID